MRLSKRTEYGLRAVVQLARLDPRSYVQSKDLAQQEGLPNKFLEAILLALRRGGFLESKVGSGGGYRLSRPPRDIRVGDLIRRLEGRLTVKEPVPDRASSRPARSPSACSTSGSPTRPTRCWRHDPRAAARAVVRAGSLQQPMYYI